MTQRSIASRNDGRCWTRACKRADREDERGWSGGGSGGAGGSSVVNPISDSAASRLLDGGAKICIVIAVLGERRCPLGFLRCQQLLSE